MRTPLKNLKTPMTPSFPKIPNNRNYIPFENPRQKCSILNCPNFSTLLCGLCELHCRKIHRGNHTKYDIDELEELIDKYLKEKDR